MKDFRLFKTEKLYFWIVEFVEANKMKIIMKSFTTAHGDSSPVRTKEQSQHINGVRSTLNNCMERFAEQKCLRALFDNEYFWNK